MSAKLKSIKVKYQNTSNVVYYMRPTEIIQYTLKQLLHVTSVQYNYETKMRLIKMFDVYFHFVQRI